MGATDEPQTKSTLQMVCRNVGIHRCLSSGKVIATAPPVVNTATPMPRVFSQLMAGTCWLQTVGALMDHKLNGESPVGTFETHSLVLDMMHLRTAVKLRRIDFMKEMLLQFITVAQRSGNPSTYGMHHEDMSRLRSAVEGVADDGGYLSDIKAAVASEGLRLIRYGDIVVDFYDSKIINSVIQNYIDDALQWPITETSQANVENLAETLKTLIKTSYKPRQSFHSHEACETLAAELLDSTIVWQVQGSEIEPEAIYKGNRTRVVGASPENFAKIIEAAFEERSVLYAYVNMKVLIAALDGAGNTVDSGSVAAKLLGSHHVRFGKTRPGPFSDADHAVAIRRPQGTTKELSRKIQVQNSWGQAFGDKGHLYLPDAS